MFKKITLLGLFLCLTLGWAWAQQVLEYHVNLNDRSGDTFKVRLKNPKLSADNEIYQFASTAPGTYQVMDMGRFVRNFKALDKAGKEIAVSQISTNQFKISKPKAVQEIVYEIAETWDTPVNENRIYRMCGSSLEDDHALINGQTVFGFPQGMQNTPLKIKLEYPQEWQIGTPLEKDKEGFYLAKNYDFIVDSPILLGRLTFADTKVKGTDIELFTYSKTDKIKSAQLLEAMSQMLKAAGDFLQELPVKRYTFLFHFEDQSAGAWEHSYSSEYIYRESEWNERLAKSITSTAAHEFFHIITPLNIHSEIIENFNFVTPTASEHLWLYEGTTEWASDFMQFRGGMITLEELFQELGTKILVNERRFDPKYSLSQISLTSYTPEGQKQYGNVYMRGAIVAGLLDIRLLELSGGKRGLREVVLELAKKYGPNKSFPEKEFFDVFTAMTYPEIGDFFKAYIRGAEPLPLAEYYAKIGILYSPSENNQLPVFQLNPEATATQKALREAWMKNL